jgi:hypothetical protein
MLFRMVRLRLPASWLDSRGSDLGFALVVVAGSVRVMAVNISRGLGQQGMAIACKVVVLKHDVYRRFLFNLV